MNKENLLYESRDFTILLSNDTIWCSNSYMLDMVAMSPILYNKCSPSTSSKGLQSSAENQRASKEQRGKTVSLK